ncbi:hypothetical protein J2X03_003810 [Microbacterium trichothecenolyticum]|uniref:hypothetical protein n=1 Tax=Microbacterium trichothecenolyticum TaxID=69370 RepID=UPI0028661FD5|nr:hypothetical protein [Microbacterium trichothecenolyticum]MDR7113908.1 hypothetical protein [Microbacterium trichothecenolyticum]
MSYALRWKDDGFVGPHAGKLISEPPHYGSQGEAETMRLGMPKGDHVEVVVVADEPEKEWAPNRAVTLAALAVIDEAHKDKPTCALCGQRCNALDKDGLCSKVRGEHEEWRADARRDEKAGAR